MVDTKPLRPRADKRFRTVDESAIVEWLLLCGWAFDVRRDGRIPAEREARAALDRWTTLGLAFAQGPGGRRFDPAEVVNFLKWAGIHQLDPFWEERFIANGRRLVREFHDAGEVSAVPPPPATLAPERFAVTLTREFDLRHVQAGSRIVLRLPRPIEDDALQDLAVVAFAPPDLDVAFSAAPGRIDARLAAPPRSASVRRSSPVRMLPGSRARRCCSRRTMSTSTRGRAKASSSSVRAFARWPNRLPGIRATHGPR